MPKINMLTINNMAGLSDKELEEAVARSCSGYGVVRKLRVYPALGTQARPFALVDMETDAQAEQLATAYSGSTWGNSVVIILQQETCVLLRGVTGRLGTNRRT